MIDLWCVPFMISWILLILYRQGQMAIYALMSCSWRKIQCSLWVLVHSGVVCTSSLMVSRLFWSVCYFFFDFCVQYKVSDAVCLERDCVWVNSRCPLTLSMTRVIRWDRSPYSGVILIDLRFFCFMIFFIPYILQFNGQLVDYKPDIAFEAGRVQLVSVSAVRSPCCTLSLVSMSTLRGYFDPFVIFLDSFDHFRVSDIACYERNCFAVDSRCPWTLSMQQVIRAEWSTQTAM